MEQLLTLPEVARVFRVSPNTLRHWVALERIPFVKVGGRIPGDRSSKCQVLFRPSDLEAYIQQCTIAPRQILSVRAHRSA